MVPSPPLCPARLLQALRGRAVASQAAPSSDRMPPSRSRTLSLPPAQEGCMVPFRAQIPCQVRPGWVLQIQLGTRGKGGHYVEEVQAR